MILAEYVLWEVITAGLKAIQDNWNDGGVTEANKILTKIFIGMPAVYRQRLGDSFAREKHNVFYNFPRNFEKVPLIAIMLPAERESTCMGEGEDENDSGVVETFAVWDTKYSVTIFHNNLDMMVMEYHILKYILTQYKYIMANFGIEGSKLSGGDLQFRPELVPPTIYSRTLSIEFIYEFRTVPATTEIKLDSVTFKGIPESTEPSGGVPTINEVDGLVQAGTEDRFESTAAQFITNGAEVGMRIGVYSSTNNQDFFTIAEVISESEVRLTQDLTPESGMSFIVF